jgi:hypothetical protein
MDTPESLKRSLGWGNLPLGTEMWEAGRGWAMYHM